MKTLALCFAMAAHALTAFFLYRMRVHGAGGMLRWDAIVFGGPFLAASGLYCMLMGGFARGVLPSWRLVGIGGLALVLAAVVQCLALAVAANVYGT